MKYEIECSFEEYITEAVSRLLVECLQYIESTLPDVIVLDCIHKISDYVYE